MSLYLKRRGLEDREANDTIFEKVAKKLNLEKHQVEAVFKHHCRFLKNCIKEKKPFMFPRVGLFKPHNKKPKTPLKDEPTS